MRTLGYYLYQGFRDILSSLVVKTHELQMVNAYSNFFFFIYYLSHIEWYLNGTLKITLCFVIGVSFIVS